MKKQNGFILISVLILMQIMVLLSFFALQTGWLEMRLSREDNERLSFHQAVSKALQQGSNCLVPISSFKEFQSRDLNWWKMNGCEGVAGKWHYFSVSEKLREDGVFRITVWIGEKEKIFQHVNRERPIINEKPRHCEECNDGWVITICPLYFAATTPP